MQRAHGSFKVDIRPVTPALAEGLARYSIDKEFGGDLNGVSTGEMYSGGDPKLGAAGYVAMELVTAKLGGRKGSFVLQHFATMDERGPGMQVVVTPGSGTGELKGLTGTLTIRIENKQHLYDFDYTVPE